MSAGIKSNERDNAIDFVKFVATLLVLNSHMDPCYVKYSFLSTGGVLVTLYFSLYQVSFSLWEEKEIS